MKQIEIGEWLYKGCFIQINHHPKLAGHIVVFKNDKEQTHIGRTYTMNSAKLLCEANECTDDYLKFD